MAVDAGMCGVGTAPLRDPRRAEGCLQDGADRGAVTRRSTRRWRGGSGAVLFCGAGGRREGVGESGGAVKRSRWGPYRKEVIDVGDLMLLGVFIALTITLES